ncbi:hypothetical protein QTP70_006129 [Hemibagrus guttatus]|uniref:ribonuclease H n=1 Tax=Hemibagrus guttatus TaxID=175788 RepID=A0AAE0V518_9TELE|nr:hypothetical protein QTP70_006129 [Hemibagrus guttatus]
MSLKLEIEGVMLNVVSGYAPQVGCELEEKERFWSELDEVMESIPTGERVVIGADFNGHVGEENTGDEEVMGKFGVKERNLEGQMVVDFAKRMDMAVVNTYFQKREEHRVTYKSGGRRTQVDYILCRRGNLKEISDCKVVVGESVARQNRMVVCRMTLMVCKKKRSETEKKTKWWKLKKEECCEEFRQKLRQALGGQVLLPDDWETTAEVIRETGRKVLGVSSGRRKEDKETWWWNEEVQDSIQRKRLAKKKWDMDRTEENRQEYKELQRRVKREVSKAKQKAYDELYTRLDTREGEKDLYRLARQRDRDEKDVQQVRVIKDRDGRVLTSEESIQRRWKEYFEELMNEENEREKRVEGVNSVEQKVDKIRKDEVRKALKRMKSGKAVGPDYIPVEVWKCLGEAAVEFLASLFNRVLESERMPEEWRRSLLVPIFKNKGDVQSCSNYRGIKLMSHTMKVWERVVEARLRKVVEICEQQYGFMPRKSTTDAIFALRILMEKYRDGQRELHCVFVDLEKAYDRVPREELWYCMRKSGVAEKYVRVVQDMYERSRTVVRCAVGQTEEFNVEVGLHQGSALSPFLFAIVMDQLSEEVRQESPWTMMFADDIVICSESREQVEENLERWRFALERRGMKVSCSKTEYMCVNEREGSGTVRLQGEEVKKVQEFKYLGSTVQSNGEYEKEVKKRVQAVNRNEYVELGTTVFLKCSNTTIAWNDMIFVIWKIHTQNKECMIAVAKYDSDHDTCHDGKKQSHTADGTYHLIIPRFSVQDEGSYTCDTSYQAGGSIEIVRVSAWDNVRRPIILYFLLGSVIASLTVLYIMRKKLTKIRGTIESVLSSCNTAWFGNCTVSDRKTLQRIVRTAEKIIGVSLPSITDMYTTRCIRKANSIVDDPTHPSHTLFTLLPFGKRDNIPRDAMQAEIMQKKELGSFFGGKELGQGNEVGHLGEVIYYGEDGADDKVSLHANKTLPRSTSTKEKLTGKISTDLTEMSLLARQHLTGWLECEEGDTVAVCQATGKPAASISWETPWNSSSSITQTM